MGTFSDRVAIAVCDRCNFKYKITELHADKNSPGLRVCDDCEDPKDPWREKPIAPDAIALRKPRPDTSIALSAPPQPLRWDTPGLIWDSTQPPLTWDETV
jgi:hypothetical protein